MPLSLLFWEAPYDYNIKDKGLFTFGKLATKVLLNTNKANEAPKLGRLAECLASCASIQYLIKKKPYVSNKYHLLNTK